MELLYKPDFEEARERWRVFWAGEIMDRPCTRVVAPREGVELPQCPSGLHVSAKDYRSVAERFDLWTSALYFGGEAIPAFLPNFGPDQFAAFFGSELGYNPESGDTSWAEPCIEDWSFTDHCFDAPNVRRGGWWSQILEFMRAATEFGEGRFLTSVPDLHSNIDCLSAMRGPQRLCENLMDCPDAVESAMLHARKAFRPVYDALFEAGKMATWGSISWLPYYCEGRFSDLQCDFAYLIGPEHMRRFVIPALEEEAAALDHCVYHYDGIPALVHLDDILAIRGIDAIQWVPGAGQPGLTEWMDLLHRIQNAGKGLVLAGSPDEIKFFHKELRPEKVFYDTWVSSPSEADALLKWLKDNT